MGTHFARTGLVLAGRVLGWRQEPAHAWALLSFPHRRRLAQRSRRCSLSGSLETRVTR